MLPYIKIIFSNGALGQIASDASGVLGMLTTGVAVGSTFQLATPYVLYGLASLTALGVTEENNPLLYKDVKQFYDNAGNGAELWLMAFPDTVKLSDMVDVTQTTKGLALLKAANGRIRGVILNRKPDSSYTPVVAQGLDPDVALARTNGQAFAEYAANTLYAPVFVLVPGMYYSGNGVDLTDLTTGADNFTQVIIGDTVADGNTAAMGLYAGRVAANAVQVNVARVKDGAITTDPIYIGSTLVDTADNVTIHNKGYVTFRTYVGRSGYFVTDDLTATMPTDDYCHLTAVRTIFEAYRIAYDTLLDLINDNLLVNPDGTLQTSVIKNIEGIVIGAISGTMTARGNLSANPTDSTDKGVKCIIPTGQNVVSTSTLEVPIKVRPFGYPKYINVPLGFIAITTS